MKRCIAETVVVTNGAREKRIREYRDTLTHAPKIVIDGDLKKKHCYRGLRSFYSVHVNIHETKINGSMFSIFSIRLGSVPVDGV